MVELLHFAVSAPTVVASSRVTEMRVAGSFQTARQRVVRRQFVSQAFILN